MTEIKNNIILSTPLDGDKPKFSIHSITGTEVLSDLFTYKLTLSSKDDKIDFINKIRPILSYRIFLNIQYC